MGASGRSENCGANDTTLIFKALVLQALYNLSDDQAEYQLRDRFSFMRFLGLELEDAVPDAKTLWLYREALAKATNLTYNMRRFVCLAAAR
jgi:transposase, IS5 family